ncbi:conserved hypothetical protein [Neospora caninum Liverpool]|uniref:Uncharacterized protein n=1 Tax=Neospora caninum (strain Liverpool) TaxID=572307 RepID=F0VEC4_NEOCL|nr:conserved hypothetical protein [Neospora caninum Liverpool]CBZ52068.1 conserved hypothetical protein [Neospora caninum Liverpool]CEL66029.1 TPA: hypothetical protein BN1204_018580 [Neospora caninum Liverpool]|eukprot:XP_003882100.1 conserved hypothetical protein [Neospora caninum Liverpool]
MEAEGGEREGGKQTLLSDDEGCEKERETPGSDAACGCACSAETQALRVHNERLSALNSVLLANMSSLYKTAKEELKRRDVMLEEKDNAIAQLQRDIQSLKDQLPTLHVPHRRAA